MRPVGEDEEAHGCCQGARLVPRVHGLGRKLNLLRQTDLSSPRVSLALRCWGPFCDLHMLPHFPPTGLAVLTWGSFFSEWRTFRMYLAHLAEGRRLIECDATSWYTDRVKAAARGLSKSEACSFAVRPAVSKDQLCQLVGSSC